MKMLIKKHLKTILYMLKLKKSFYGILCDFDSMEFVDADTKSIVIDDSTCKDITNNTI